MINLIIGKPGGGKSYEAVAFHILPNLEDGRKVITNLPLNLEHFHAVIPDSRRLLEVNHEPRHFNKAEHFNDPWRCPSTNRGPVYVLDECHELYPRLGCDSGVLEWFARHRHTGADFLLITQSYGKLHADLRDMVQVCYRVSKKVAFGRPDQYVRKVQDGIRGEVMSIQERDYESKYFPFYKSHTASNSAILEADAKDIKPAYLIWRRRAMFVLAFAALWLCFAIYQTWFKEKPAQPEAVAEGRAGGAPASGEVPDLTYVTPPATTPLPVPHKIESSPPNAHASAPVLAQKHPYEGLSVHIAGSVSKPGRMLYSFVLAQNGQAVSIQTSDDFKSSGYTVTAISECAARIEYPEADPFFVRCDVPKLGPELASTAGTG
ncbi:zonular occludens toxin domain-containing protein [Chitinilyticum litopenaei]|uniref:zonular occludens toxin domain-containing protein n=1 Tax=Chitinilyticum litopenaei TaxID=1121276 RepID=UPI00041A4D64|nr:zonular occludens toxin domain-containing protein [Chitinilyticum litopenaei]